VKLKKGNLYNFNKNTTMTKRERFRNSLYLKEVDKLPHGEQMIHDELCAKITHEYFDDDHTNALLKWMCQLLPEQNFQRHKKVREMMNFDWVHLFPAEPLQDITMKPDGNMTAKDIWGQTLLITNQSTEIIETPINDLSDMKKYEFPDVSKFDFSDIRRWQNETDFWVTTQIDSGYFKAVQLIGFNRYMEYCMCEPDALTDFMEKFTDFQMRLSDKLMESGADSIWFSDDHCFNSGPMMSPDMHYDFDFKYLRQLVDHVHSKGFPANFHSCGNVKDTIKMVIETGVNSIHALQPSAGNKIYEYKKEYGKDVCLIGNFDMDRLMPLGSPYEIDKAVKEMIDNVWHDRTGYILATCNMLNYDQPVENALTLHAAAEKYGR
jgi:uroporphyrinogen decarboxylase